jgi:hypothetical protein
MNTELLHFAAQMGRAILMALVPVALTAFLSIPLSLGGHPGEATTTARTVVTATHMT